ncbi:MAG TPA: RsmG family class I SAM-dependent methyltransferase [Acidimicrobiales bacterium]|nr:RsmG family class I SAM-dependent methyltransferase [Acidimicrobiales bacterium]
MTPAEGVREILAEAQRLGFIGGPDLGPHLHHAEAFSAVVERLGVPSAALDLGSGGGLPGLVLADRWPTCSWWLVDASQRRTAFLTRAIVRLGWTGRVQVRRGRAEELARDPHLRAAMDLVTARGFGRPAVTAECAAGFLRAGGHLVVSEPPPDRAGSDRWPADGLAPLGLEVVEAEGLASAGAQLRVLRQTGACPDRYPRRVGVPAKRPLF